ncbi:thioesterase family protein [uncultured Bradyrhizobium sp.]|uniref:thioesterase family protein n=1 Tax=uncultured Bradyrhizobium sp. TaxID=199684 RepID=UPI0035CC2A88
MTDTPAQQPRVSRLHYSVSYPDTDSAGVVNHCRYMEMSERARHHLLKSVGLSYAILCADHATLLLIHKISAVFRKSALLEDELLLVTALTEASRSRTSWLTRIMRNGTELAQVSAEVVALAPESRTVQLMPKILLERLAPFIGALD